MTDFFKNNPTALRHCIRFEILQGNSIEQAYSNICTVLGEEVIDYKKFKIKFNHFSKKKFNDKEQEKPCANILRNDKYALRVCILYESLKYQSDKLRIPIFEVFMNFCKVIGVEDVLKYPDFEFWFYRFLNGEHDLNYERDMDKKVYELMDMPIDVMKNVVEYMDIFDRFKLAKTSRSFQTFVEDQKLFHHTLKLIVDDKITTISFDKSDNIQYTWKNVGRSKRLRHWEQSLLVLKSILKNPKLHLDTFFIESNVNQKNVFNDFGNALEFTHLNVKNLILETYSSYLLVEILPKLKPGYLTSIDINSHGTNVVSFERVFEMEQWKQAKYFRMDGFFMWSLHHLYHLKEFDVGLKEFSVENIRQIKEILFKSPDFEKCLVFFASGIDRSIIEQEIGNALREDPYIYQYPIPNSTEYFEIKVERLFVGHHCKVTRNKK